MKTHFIDLKKTVDEKPYIQITESRKLPNGKFQRHNIMIFQEDITNLLSKNSLINLKLVI